ncbi:DUF1697 domain-containing protein [Niveibacterium sp. SC-1]|uniref:DUF1697 domain-containing protein n=1 Tax=Niveibacterium sp. SC-1 TaxID=3135646 RepID=UPI00311DD1D5
MPRYLALLRGVSPTNASMPELRRCFEEAGFTQVRTVLASGNVVFDARSAASEALARRAEKAMQDGQGRSFDTIVRPLAALQAVIDADPFGGFALAPGAKRVITFLRSVPEETLTLPIERDGASILARQGLEVFSAYVVSEKGPVFMHLLERCFGKSITTRTLDTVIKCLRA